MSFDANVGDYLTYQCGILKNILSNFSDDELKEAKLVSKEWKRLVTNILDSRQYFCTTLYHRNSVRFPFDAKRIKLKPEQFSFFICQKMILKDLCAFKKLINHHLLNIKDYENFRVISGKYLPPVAVGTCGLAFDYYFLKTLVNCGSVGHGFHSTSVDVSIFQLQVCFSSTKLKQVLQEASNEPIKGMMAFVSPGYSRRKTYAKEAVTTFRTIVQSVQTEPIISAGVTVDMSVLLPEHYTCDCDFDTTIIVFRGKGLKVTSDIFEWTDSEDAGFTEFLTKLVERAGPPPVGGTRIIYVFECYRVKDNLVQYLKKIGALCPGVEVAIIRSKYNEFYYNTNDTTRTLENSECDIRTYSTIINIYDFAGVPKTTRDVLCSSGIVTKFIEYDPFEKTSRPL
ncbi:hypothetical protein WDU94_008239 [Cyamophila willieti]